MCEKNIYIGALKESTHSIKYRKICCIVYRYSKKEKKNKKETNCITRHRIIYIERERLKKQDFIIIHLFFKKDI